MKITPSMIKANARALLLGKYNIFALCVIAYYASNLIATAIPSAIFAGTEQPVQNVILRILLSFLLLTLVNLVKVGVSRAAYCTCHEKEISYQDIFFAFGESRDQFLKIEMLLSGIQSVISLLLMYFEHLNSVYSFDIWEYYGLYIAFSALVVVLNLAVSLRFTFAVYAVLDNPGISASAALKTSLALTRGRYFKYLWFRLTFAGMYILGYISFLIGFIYVLPYIEVSTCLYYYRAAAENTP